VTSKAKSEYCFQLIGNETCDGPFESENIAMAEAKQKLLEDNYHLPAKVRIGQVKHARPEDHAKAVDVDTVIETMEQSAFDNELSWCDEPVFETKRGAAEALRQALEGWAREWVTSDKRTIVCDHEWLLGIDHEWHRVTRAGETGQ